MKWLLKRCPRQLSHVPRHPRRLLKRYSVAANICRARRAACRTSLRATRYSAETYALRTLQAANLAIADRSGTVRQWWGNATSILDVCQSVVFSVISIHILIWVGKNGIARHRTGPRDAAWGQPHDYSSAVRVWSNFRQSAMGHAVTPARLRGMSQTTPNVPFNTIKKCSRDGAYQRPCAKLNTFSASRQNVRAHEQCGFFCVFLNLAGNNKQ